MVGAAPCDFQGAGFLFPSMRYPLKRFYGRGDLHFVTFSCYQRRPLLGTHDARDGFVKVLDEVRKRHKFQLIGYVVMPEHVHLLMSEPPKGNPSKVLQVLKQKTSGELQKEREWPLALRLPKERNEEEHFWQRRFYDFNVYSEKKLKEKLDYMHANPVTRKLVAHPKDWPWSSFSFYAKGEGLIPIDAVRD